MDFKITTSFDDDISRLSKSKNHYGNLCEDIKSLFKDKTFDQIFAMSECIRSFGKSRTIKTRCKNSRNSRGKNAGYRLVFIATQEIETIIFLHVYPKQGPDAQENFDDEDLTRRLTELGNEKAKSSLKEAEFMRNAPIV